jgi:D-3-phosphoglycerate dehydrogenase
MVAAYGQAFRMRVLGCDPSDFALVGEERVDFATLLREADVISIHLHLNDTTRRLFSRDSFAAMKNGVILINTSRGAIIDEAALLEALESGKVAAAGVDVIDGEWMADITLHPLVRYAQQHDNLVITPHIGGATVESIAGARIFIIERLAKYLVASAQWESA